ncbi:MAG TPA: hypothetical protein VNZ64_22235 [Candidatus Acidoferrum sp.]|jgi:hypothetical protein|nr:hypothetical protein [Candidatus Acidoferrum sp.]
MIIPPIFEIGAVSVIASGVARHEHIAFRPTEPVNLAQFGILLGFQQENSVVTPIKDNLFWFGELEVSPPCWVVLYTGKGEYHVTHHFQTKHPVHVFYWGRETTLFKAREVVPVLVRMGGVAIGGHLTPPPKFAELLLAAPPAAPSSTR